MTRVARLLFVVMALALAATLIGGTWVYDQLKRTRLDLVSASTNTSAFSAEVTELRSKLASRDLEIVELKARPQIINTLEVKDCNIETATVRTLNTPAAPRRHSKPRSTGSGSWAYIKPPIK